MKHRRLGKTGLEVSVVGFGAIKLPQVSEEEAVEMLNRALDLGMNFVDTARNYKDSEHKIGVALSGRRSEFYLATKTAGRDAESAKRDLEESLKQLRTDYIDLYQLHSVSEPETYKQVMSKGGALEAMKEAREQGIVRHIGITIHRSISNMKAAIQSGEFETIMVAYSPLDQENVEKEILPMAQEHDLGVIIMKPLSGGHLKSGDDENAPRPDPIVQGALRFIISNDAVSVVIPGMMSVAHVEDNAAVGDMEPMTDEEKDELIKAIGKLGKSFRYGQVCLRCGYCLPCKVGIDIPTVFRAYDMYREYPAPVKEEGLALYASLEVKPDECVECGECAEKCPAGIPIPERLKEVVEAMGSQS